MITEEIWKDIPGYEGLYQASNLGRFRSLPRKGTKGGIMKCWTRRSTKCRKAAEYLRVPLTKNHKTVWGNCHRIIAELFVPNPDNLEMVDHINNIGCDNRAVNLQWISRQDNIKKEWAKKIKCAETGQIFNSITEAYEFLGISKHSSGISQALKTNKTAYGFTWQEV